MAIEPLVRIGIVRSVDRTTNISFETPGLGYTLQDDVGSLPQPLPPNRPIRVATSDGKLVLETDTISRSGFHNLRLVPPQSERTNKRSGVIVRRIPVGRGFHWQKAVDQVLTGVLEFLVRDNHLVVTNELPIEDYIVGVITAEMSGNCPSEFLKAHAVASRSWLLAQRSSTYHGEPFTWCNDDCCQRYQGTSGWTVAAIDATSKTRGQVLTATPGTILPAYYSKNSGGILESPESAWRVRVPGLRARVDAPSSISPECQFFPVTERNISEYVCGDWLSGTRFFAGPNAVAEHLVARLLGRVDDGESGFRWMTEVTQEELRVSVGDTLGTTDIDVVQDIALGKRGASGRLEQIEVTYLTAGHQVVRRVIGSQHKIRRALDHSHLRSSAFIVYIDRDRRGVISKATFRGAGWGHGVGFCQIGGLGRALAGQNYTEILKAYFDATIEQAYA